MDRITSGGDQWDVLECTSDGSPLKVQHTHPAMRGSVVEAAMNAALAVRQMKVALHMALPLWLRRHIPVPRAWWAWLPTDHYIIIATHDAHDGMVEADI